MHSLRDLLVKMTFVTEIVLMLNLVLLSNPLLTVVVLMVTTTLNLILIIITDTV